MRKRLLVTLFSFLLISSYIRPQNLLVVDPNTRYQQLEGWGGSLAWWANIAGGWSDDKINEFCTWISSSNELNMNVYRFNIGGGDNPAHTHMRTDGGNMPGYKASATDAYNWAQDANQRKIAQKLKSLRSDAVFEAFSCSPPYWMTKSGCSAGSSDGYDNLKDDQYTVFADYLSEVVKYYHDNYGITFRTLEPFNESFSTWWKANGAQEGCYFSQSNQNKLIREVYNKLSSKGMLGYCGISAMDANSIDECVTGVNGYASAGDIISKLGQFNTHTYAGTKRTELYNLSKTYNKRLTQSESGPLSITATGMDNYLVMAQRIITDLRDLKPVIWCDWQFMTNGDPKWGLIVGNYTNQTYKKDKSYYVRQQCSKFIKQGYTIIQSNDGHTVAAINPAGTELVLVVCNQNSTPASYNVDLNLFASAGTTASVYRTSGGCEAVHWYSSAYQVYTLQVKTSLANGTYTATAWVRSGGGQTECYLAAKNYGGAEMHANIPANGSWTQITIPNIVVSNGQCEIGVWSNAPANAWCAFDDLEFYNNSSPQTNLLTNPAFEIEGPTQTPSGWTTTSTVSANADYTQSGGHSNNEDCLRLSDQSITYNKFTYPAPSRSVTTFVIPVTVNTTWLSGGTYTITAKHSSKCMSISGWSQNNGGQCEQWDCLDQDNVKFIVTYKNNGFYSLKAKHLTTEKVLSVDGQVITNGALIKQWDDSGRDDQRFSIIPIGSGYYKIVNKKSAKCLAVTGNGTANGDDVVQWEWINYDNAKWTFNSVLAKSTFITNTMEESESDPEFKIFPNPAQSGNVKLLLPEDDMAHCEILNMNGAIILKGPIVGNSYSFDVARLQGKGMYFVTVIGSKKTYKGKLVIQ